MGVLARLAGNGFGAKWGVSWLPEVLFSIPFGVAFAYAVSLFASFPFVIAALFGATAWTYGWMQSGTWPILPWDVEGERNPERNATLRPIADWITKKLNVKFDSEAYAWVYAAVKGFLIGLPVGGLPLAILWPLGYEIGSHFRGKTDKFGFDAHVISEAATGVGAGIAITLFVKLIGLI